MKLNYKTLYLKGWGLHACGWLSFDRNCRAFGAPRIHIITPLRNIGIAVTPGAKFAGRRDDPARWLQVVRHPERLH